MDFVRLHFISGGRAGARACYSLNHGGHNTACPGVRTSDSQLKKFLLHRRGRETAEALETVRDWE